jgi:hypothetical protein
MILAQGTENGLNWSLDAKGMNIYIRVIQDNTNKEFVKKCKCQFEPTWRYDISDVNAVNKILDDMIKEILSLNYQEYSHFFKWEMNWGLTKYKYNIIMKYEININIKLNIIKERLYDKTN